MTKNAHLASHDIIQNALLAPTATSLWSLSRSGSDPDRVIPPRMLSAEKHSRHGEQSHSFCNFFVQHQNICTVHLELLRATSEHQNIFVQHQNIRRSSPAMFFMIAGTVRCSGKISSAIAASSRQINARSVTDVRPADRTVCEGNLTVPTSYHVVAGL